MSFFEDNYDGFEPDDLSYPPEHYWEQGLHCTANEDIIKLKDMSVSHLRNTIRYFNGKGHDTSIVEKTLQKKLKVKSK